MKNKSNQFKVTKKEKGQKRLNQWLTNKLKCDERQNRKKFNEGFKNKPRICKYER